LTSETLDSFVIEPKTEDHPTIIVDSHEATSASGIVKKLVENGVTITTKHLEKGDYVISDRCAIERKTVRDFAYTLTRRHLFDQILTLKNHYETTILLLEGYLPMIYKFTRVNPMAIWGAMFSLAKKGIPLIHTSNQKETVDFLITAGKQEQFVSKRIPTLHAVKNKQTLGDSQLYLIASLPNIGHEKAVAILQTYNTPLDALSNLETWSKQVHGIGPLITRKVSRIINTPFVKGQNPLTSSETHST
jgi:ERCC4-type nuclease